MSQRAIHLATSAVEADKNGNVSLAFSLYQQAISVILNDIKTMRLTATVQKQWKQTIVGYLSRAEQLKSQMHFPPSTNPELRNVDREDTGGQRSQVSMLTKAEENERSIERRNFYMNVYGLPADEAERTAKEATLLEKFCRWSGFNVDEGGKEHMELKLREISLVERGLETQVKKLVQTANHRNVVVPQTLTTDEGIASSVDAFRAGKQKNSSFSNVEEKDVADSVAVNDDENNNKSFLKKMRQDHFENKGFSREESRKIVSRIESLERFCEWSGIPLGGPPGCQERENRLRKEVFASTFRRQVNNMMKRAEYDGNTVPSHLKTKVGFFAAELKFRKEYGRAISSLHDLITFSDFVSAEDVRQMLQQDQRSGTMKDLDGNSPLLLLCKWQERIDIDAFKMLLEAWPESLIQCDAQGNNAIEWLIENGTLDLSIIHLIYPYFGFDFNGAKSDFFMKNRNAICKRCSVHCPGMKDEYSQSSNFNNHIWRAVPLLGDQSENLKNLFQEAKLKKFENVFHRKEYSLKIKKAKSVHEHLLGSDAFLVDEENGKFQIVSIHLDANDVLAFCEAANIDTTPTTSIQASNVAAYSGREVLFLNCSSMWSTWTEQCDVFELVRNKEKPLIMNELKAMLEYDPAQAFVIEKESGCNAMHLLAKIHSDTTVQGDLYDYVEMLHYINRECWRQPDVDGNSPLDYFVENGTMTFQMLQLFLGNQFSFNLNLNDILAIGRVQVGKKQDRDKICKQFCPLHCPQRCADCFQVPIDPQPRILHHSWGTHERLIGGHRTVIDDRLHQTQVLRNLDDILGTYWGGVGGGGVGVGGDGVGRKNVNNKVAQLLRDALMKGNGGGDGDNDDYNNGDDDDDDEYGSNFNGDDDDEYGSDDNDKEDEKKKSIRKELLKKFLELLDDDEKEVNSSRNKKSNRISKFLRLLEQFESPVGGGSAGETRTLGEVLSRNHLLPNHELIGTLPEAHQDQEIQNVTSSQLQELIGLLRPIMLHEEQNVVSDGKSAIEEAEDFMNKNNQNINENDGGDWKKEIMKKLF
eukprot:g5536.t1